MLGTMHPRKGRVVSYRDLVANSHQFNAVSRSSLLLAPHPEDQTKRVVAWGKGNHAGLVPTLEFRIEPVTFDAAQRQADNRRPRRRLAGDDGHDRAGDQRFDRLGSPRTAARREVRRRVRGADRASRRACARSRPPPAWRSRRPTGSCRSSRSSRRRPGPRPAGSCETGVSHTGENSGTGQPEGPLRARARRPKGVPSHEDHAEWDTPGSVGARDRERRPGGH